MTDTPAKLRPRRYATARPADAATYTHPIDASVVDASEGDDPTRIALLREDELDYYRVGMVVEPTADELWWTQELGESPATVAWVEWHDGGGLHLHRAWVRTSEVIRYTIAEEDR